MFANIKLDTKRFIDNAFKVDPGNKSPLKVIQLLLLSQGLHSIIIYRLGQFAKKQQFPLRQILLFIHFILEKIVCFLYGIHLSIDAEIGEGFYIGHFGGIEIGECKIGKNCSIYQRVVINSNQAGVPIIADRVWIGAHSQIIGPVSIDEGATVSAGSVVEEDLPSRCVVAGHPARVIKLEFDNSGIH